jgi:hypothetical protein
MARRGHDCRGGDRKPTLVAVAAVLILTIAATCWVLANRERTSNVVSIIAAARGRPPSRKRRQRKRPPPG